MLGYYHIASPYTPAPEGKDAKAIRLIESLWVQKEKTGNARQVRVVGQSINTQIEEIENGDMGWKFLSEKK